ncbi:MAG: M48 family metallopeptidase [Leptospiraceae bacterium]|nr:M48 family metallopeptidase [Leptospiraceae bacterium]MDW7976387.1 M48 family metallopeptidase [Leptospiraceae bacterium]
MYLEKSYPEDSRYMERTRESFKSYVLKWAQKIGVANKIMSIHLRPMKKKIASCSSKGRLTFDPGILKESQEKMDYIIVHELLHLRYPNHGKMFKLLLKIYLKKKT